VKLGRAKYSILGNRFPANDNKVRRMLSLPIDSRANQISQPRSRPKDCSRIARSPPAFSRCTSVSHLRWGGEGGLSVESRGEQESTQREREREREREKAKRALPGGRA
jgi:hypothetical protein